MFGKYGRRWTSANRKKSRSLLKRDHWARMARVSTSLGASSGGRLGPRGASRWFSRHQSSTSTNREISRVSKFTRHRLPAGKYRGDGGDQAENRDEAAPSQVIRSPFR